MYTVKQRYRLSSIAAVCSKPLPNNIQSVAINYIATSYKQSYETKSKPEKGHQKGEFWAKSVEKHRSHKLFFKMK